ncbi:fused MFS/spermidine synthase [Variovorax robiniae]|uniref:Fused MFS/spermidine synthase n=1 Tax=Variovorax robiniae TaxID=1836199 RepID=A0ABU8XJR7_9BURK
MAPRLRWPAVLLFASGAAALVYQVLWIKQLALIVGVDVQAVSIGVGAFFAGLAVGGGVLGRLADRSTRPWHLYAVLEVAAAVLGVGVTWALGHSAESFVWLLARVGPLAWALPLVLVAVPATLLGGTLPVLMRALAPALERLAGAGARLYAANTFGAIVGTLLGAFVLIPWLGLRGSAWAAALLNLLAAAGAIWLAGRVPAAAVAANASPMAASHSRAETSAAEALRPAQVQWALVLYALAGALALGYEVVWSQAIVQFTSTRSFAFAIVLATYLLGLVLGSALVARWADRLRDPWSAFAWFIGGAGALALLEVSVLGPWLVQAQSVAESVARSLGAGDLIRMSVRFAVAGFSLVFLPTLLLGAAFPIALRLAADAQRVGTGVGRVLALNTLGGIVGTALAGFVLVPWLGLVYSLAVLAVGACAVALISVFAGHGVRPVARLGVAALAVAVFGAAWMAPPERLAQLLTEARGGRLDFYEESRGATVAVIEQRSGSNRFHRLYIQGVSNSGDAMTSRRYMRLQALLPLIVHGGEPRSALVIGLGTGITAGALLAWPGLNERVVVELLPAVVRAAPNFRGNYELTTDPRMDIRLRDGRRELLQSEQRYDLITLEPPPPSAAGVVNLYSTDFYRLAARRLQTGGLIAQWLPLPTQNNDDTRALVQSFLAVFPYATLWTTELHEMMLVGSMQPIVLNGARIAARFAQPSVHAALAEVGVTTPAALMATWVGDRAMLERYAGDSPQVTDDRPRIEYASWVRLNEFPGQLTQLLQARSEPPLQGADASVLRDIEHERSVLLRFYSAGLNAYRGDRAGWASDIRAVMREDPDNPYYRWFVGPTGR